MNNEKIFMGLDLGTNSCGWAVTNQSYNLLKQGNKSLWGVRLFDEGQSASIRRLKRSNRRRIDRKKWRIDILQDLFSSEISKVDSEFFLRLNNSFYQYEDKKSLGKYSLFNDKNYSDKKYYSEYPTIYHLRQYLKTNQSVPDLRWIYLACHHIIKYRGHFLMDNLKVSSENNDDEYFFDLFNDLEICIEEYLPNINIRLDFNQSKYDEFMSIISFDYTPKKLAEKLNILLNQSKDKNVKIIIDLLSGLKIKSNSLLGFEEQKEYKINSISFSDEKYELEIEPVLFEVFDEAANVIISLKKIYDLIILKQIIGSSSSISEAMIILYNKHHDDITTLKQIYKKYLTKSDYYSMFRSSEEDNNYCAYVKTNQVNNKKSYVHGCQRNVFLKAVKSQLESIAHYQEDNKIITILSDIQNDSFLPKLSTKANASLPYQIHLSELEVILKNNAKFYPFFNFVDSSGYSFVEKIMMLMTFKIPYYVGPLNNYHKSNNGGFSWIIRKEKGQVLPWNYYDKVNEEESQKAFILKMTNKCTYLKGKDVLPRSSLLYSEYALLNEINKIQINGEPISIETKNCLMKNLFKKVKKVSEETLKSFFKRNGSILNSKEIKISGIDGDIKNSMSSYIDFEKIFGEITFNNIKMIERIIFLITIFEDKNSLKKIIKDEFNLSDEIISKILRLQYKGWGRFSREFLETDVIRVDELGVVHSIITEMRNNNYNLMETLYNPQFNFVELVDEINQGEFESNDYSYNNLVDSLNCSPSIKRSIWQTVKLVKEVKKSIKNPINKFFVEVTREKNESKKTISRRYLIENYLKNSKELKIEYEKLSNELNHVTDSQLRSDRIYLYFVQLGRCLYSNQPIDLDLLSSGKYDIDHIIPRSFLKDDSIDNRVLVLSELNKEKGDNYPLASSIQNIMEVFWDKLKDNGLISEKKYARLTRKNELSDDEIGDFINRQLVFTNQSVKSLIDVLKIISPESEIIYSKASNVGEFRQDFELLKSREINDLHHAHDAYLNIVVGNVYHTKYGFDARKVIKNLKDSKYSIGTKKIFDRDYYGVWKVNGESINLVKATLSQTDPIITRMTYDSHGQFYDETRYPKNSQLYPIKENNIDPISNTAKYGGYKSLKIAFFVIVESDNKKGERIRTIEGIPVIFVNRISKNSFYLYVVLKDYLKLINPIILVHHVQIKSLLRIDKTYFYLSGKTGDKLIVSNASQMFADKWLNNYVRLIVKHRENISKNENIELYDYDDYVISESKNINKPDLKISTSDNIKLYDIIINQLRKPIYKNLSIYSTIPKLEQARANFVFKNVRIQAYVLYEMLHFIQTKSIKSNLSYIAENSSFLGSNTINKNISKINIEVIDQSISGLYESVRWKNTYGV